MSTPDLRARVVVPHYEAPERLARLLAALDAQTGAAFEVVVADDGSRVPPDPGPHAYPVRVVAQADEGFRAAAARNLGAGAGGASGPDALLFLDADMVPTPTYVAAMLAALRGADVVVGRRRHTDLTGRTPEEIRAWLTRASTTDNPAGPAALGAPVLPEPGWLADGYAATGGLADLSDDGFRYVISAVLGVRRDTFERLGGFEESFVGYGGEDWEFAHRAWLAGADFAYVPAAVAWHDGPDWGGRHDEDEAGRRARVAAKNVESLAVADLVPSPRHRDDHRVWSVPRVLVELDPAVAALEGAEAFAVVADLVRGSDARVVVAAGAPVRRVWPAGDPALLDDPPGRAVTGRSPWRARVHAPVRLDEPGALTRLVEAGEAAYVADGRPVLTLRHARSIARGQEPPRREWPHPLPAPGPPDLEARWGGWG